MIAPTFTHAELISLWEAISQYVENAECGEDLDGVAPPPAVAARDKLDAYVASQAPPLVADRPFPPGGGLLGATARLLAREEMPVFKRCAVRCPVSWTCRTCGAKCCEHRCSRKKNDGTAACAACQRASRPV